MGIEIHVFNELESYIHDPNSFNWNTNETLVKEIEKNCQELHWCSRDITQAHENAKKAMDQLRLLTESHATKLKYLYEQKDSGHN